MGVYEAARNDQEIISCSSDTPDIRTALNDWGINTVILEVSLINLSVIKRLRSSLEIMMKTLPENNGSILKYILWSSNQISLKYYKPNLVFLKKSGKVLMKNSEDSCAICNKLHNWEISCPN